MVITIDKEKFYEVLEDFPTVREAFVEAYWEEELKGETTTKKTIKLNGIKELWKGRILIKIGESKTVSVFFKNRRLIANKFIASLIGKAKFFSSQS